MADPITGTVICSFTPPGENDPVTRSASFTFDPENSFNERIDIVYKNEADGGPVFLPENMPSGL